MPMEALVALADPMAAAKVAGLAYVSDDQPGIARISHGKHFRYVLPGGKPLSDPDQIARIKSLAIPPAWRDVWICSSANGHLQATGRDAKGRKQHRYHRRWREVRDETKYNRMIAFAKVLPRIRRRAARDLRLPGLPKHKVLATVVKILETGLVRIGNEEYVRANRSYGLTTMRDHHVDVTGQTIHFEFKGKAGKSHSVDIRDRRLASIVKNCQDIPGQELFQYLDEEGQRQKIDSTDVNEYLREIAGADFTAKDFRTWAGTVLAAIALQEMKEVDSQAQMKKNILRAIESVAARLGNTPAICRKCYIHPFVLDSYIDGTMVQVLAQTARQNLKRHLHSLSPEEASVLTLLQRRLASERKRNSRSLEDLLQASIKHRRTKMRRHQR